MGLSIQTYLLLKYGYQKLYQKREKLKDKYFCNF